MAGVDHGAAFQLGLEEQHPAAQAGDDPVPVGECALVGVALGEVLGDQGAAPLGDGPPQVGALQQVGAVQVHRQHAHGPAPGGEGPFEGGAVHTLGLAADHHRVPGGQLVADALRRPNGALPGAAGAGDGDGRAAVQVRQLALYIQYRGRVRNIPQALGIFPALRGEDLPAHFQGVFQPGLGGVQGEVVQALRLLVGNVPAGVPQPGAALVELLHAPGVVPVELPGEVAALPQGLLQPDPIGPVIHGGHLPGSSPTGGWWPPPRR